MSSITYNNSFTKACPLCKGKAILFTTYTGKDYFRCGECQLLFLDPLSYVNHVAEKKRYETHNNDVTDPAYQNFVSPITTAILNDFEPTTKGLDYGCGTGPVATVVLQKKGFNNIALYDPYFENYPERLTENTYDFIICCEVMEHFHHPNTEFKQLSKMLKSSGKLYLKTKLFPRNKSVADFESWHYKNDETHVCFYSLENLKYIAQRFNLELEVANDQLICFKSLS